MHKWPASVSLYKFLFMPNMVNKSVWSFCKGWSYIPLWKTYDSINQIWFRIYTIFVIMRKYFYCLGKVKVSVSERQRFRNMQRLEKWSASIHTMWVTVLYYCWKFKFPWKWCSNNPSATSANSYVMFSAKYVMWRELCYWNFATCVK